MILASFGHQMPMLGSPTDRAEFKLQDAALTSERRSSFEYEDLLACGRGELFGPGNAQLAAAADADVRPHFPYRRERRPARQGRGAGGIRDHARACGFSACHFKGNPVMPGCLGLDALWQMCGFFLGWLGLPGRGMALGVGEVKFTGMITPAITQGRLWRRSEARVPRQARPRHRRRLGRGGRHAHLRGQGSSRRSGQGRGGGLIRGRR